MTKFFQALMAEWLRRVIRNHLGSSRAGSNPVQCACFFDSILRKFSSFSSMMPVASKTFFLNKIKLKLRSDLFNDRLIVTDELDVNVISNR